MAVRFPDDFQMEGEILWTSPLAPPISYSDGDKSENYLAKSLSEVEDVSSSSEDLEEKIINWPSEYHFSSQRANLLRPFNFKPGTRILEIGSGCGAITRYLAEQDYEITALEGSYRRAQIGQMRCRGLKNVKIISSNLWDVEFREKFDVVTLIGVLEYAAKYGQNRDITDFGRTIAWAKKVLKPDGVLIVAIENKFGLKYMSGCPEDHTGRYFEGLEGYYKADEVRTFGKAELTNLLLQNGFRTTRFFLPFPDYKIPSVILAETKSYSDSPYDLNLGGWCDMPFESYGPNRKYLMNDQLAIREFEKNGLLDEIANSHLVFATEANDFTSTALELDSKWVAKKFNLGRGRGFQTVTTLSLKDKPVITKERLFHQSENSDDQNLALSTSKVEEYLCGREKLSLELVRAVRSKQDGHTRFWELFRRYHSYLLSCADKDGFLPANAIDLAPFNVMINPDGSLQGFDYEWVIKDKVPLKRVLFRGAMVFYSRERKWLKNLKERPISSISFAKLVFAKLRIRLKNKEIRQYLRDEETFQKLAGSQDSSSRKPLRKIFAGYLAENASRPWNMVRDLFHLTLETPRLIRSRVFRNRPPLLFTQFPDATPRLPQKALIRKTHSPWSHKLRRMLLLEHYFLLENLVIRNLKVKYRRSFFGFFWTLLHPLLSSSVFYFLFKHVARLDIPNYGAFVVVSNIPWTFFSQSVIEAAECMVMSRDLLRKIYCPREVFPMSAVITNFITLILSFPVIAIFANLGGGNLDITLLALIPVAFLTLMAAYTFGLLLSVLYVFFRDVKHLIGIMIQIMFFATPVVYEAAMVPENMRSLLYINPMAAIIPAYRAILLKNQWPDWVALGNASVIIAITGMVAYYMFAQYNRAIPEYV